MKEFKVKVKIKGARSYQARRAAKKHGFAKILSDQREEANIKKTREKYPDYKPPIHGRKK